MSHGTNAVGRTVKAPFTKREAVTIILSFLLLEPRQANAAF